MSDGALPNGCDGRVSFERCPDGTPLVILRGDIDFRRAPLITQTVARSVEQRTPRIELELSDVVFMDSSGISALIDSVKLAQRAGVRLVLVSPTRQLLHLLEISGFCMLFDFENLPTPPPKPAVISSIPTVRWQFAEFSIPCDPELVGEVRHRVQQMANSMPFTQEEIEDIELAVGEAATNAFRYGCPRGCADRIGIRCLGDIQALAVEITDAGPGFDPSQIPVPVPGSLEMGGRGIFFMKLVMDEVEFTRMKTGTHVRMVKYVRAASTRQPSQA